MHFANLYNCLHEAHKAVRTEPPSPNAQAAAINALFLFLDGRRNQLFPSLLYTQAIQMLLWFLKHVLPGLEGLNEEDHQDIAEDYSTLIAQLNESAVISQNIERSLYQVIQKLITGVFRHEQELEEALREIGENPPQDALPAAQLAETLDRNHIYLMSKLDDSLLEDLDITPIASPVELNRLLARVAGRDETCILLSNAAQAKVTVAEGRG